MNFPYEEEYKRYLKRVADSQGRRSSVKAVSKKVFKNNIKASLESLIKRYGEDVVKMFSKVNYDYQYEDYGDEDCQKIWLEDIKVELVIDRYKYEKYLNDTERKNEKELFDKFLSLNPDKYQTIRTWTEEDIQSKGDEIFYNNALDEFNRDFAKWRLSM